MTLPREPSIARNSFSSSDGGVGLCLVSAWAIGTGAGSDPGDAAALSTDKQGAIGCPFDVIGQEAQRNPAVCACPAVYDQQLTATPGAGIEGISIRADLYPVCSGNSAGFETPQAAAGMPFPQRTCVLAAAHPCPGIFIAGVVETADQQTTIGQWNNRIGKGAWRHRHTTDPDCFGHRPARVDAKDFDSVAIAVVGGIEQVLPIAAGPHVDGVCRHLFEPGWSRASGAKCCVQLHHWLVRRE